MTISQDRWFEVWCEEGSDLLPYYMLVVIPDQARPGLVMVCDPLENNRIIHDGQDYKETCYWLAEDEYSRVTGRMFVDNGW